MRGAFHVVRDFEAAICEYTGAPYCVTTNSCTMALLLACRWLNVGEVCIPRRTYISVPMSIFHAGGVPVFRDVYWTGGYQLEPYPIWDYARRFTSGMYEAGQFQCVSFHISKTLGLEQGGAILHDDAAADIWFRKARFDGRTEGVAPKDDTFDTLGWHCYLSPTVAALGLWKLPTIPRHNEDLENDEYPDLSETVLFR